MSSGYLKSDPTSSPGAELRARLDRAGITLRDLAEAAGISGPYAYQQLAGLRTLTPELVRVAEDLLRARPLQHINAGLALLAEQAGDGDAP